jgi:hypothetical protein
VVDGGLMQIEYLDQGRGPGDLGLANIYLLPQNQ